MSIIQQRFNRIKQSIHIRAAMENNCPDCGASNPSEMVIIPTGISNYTHEIIGKICMNSYHTHYPKIPTVVPNHPESPSEPGAPHSSQ